MGHSLLPFPCLPFHVFPHLCCTTGKGRGLLLHLWNCADMTGKTRGRNGVEGACSKVNVARARFVAALFQVCFLLPSSISFSHTVSLWVAMHYAAAPPPPNCHHSLFQIQPQTLHWSWTGICNIFVSIILTISSLPSVSSFPVLKFRLESPLRRDGLHTVTL